MNKLLLFATSFFCFTLQGFSAGIPHQGGTASIRISFNDSLITKQVNNPKEGFRDLFENVAVRSNGRTQLNPKAVSFVEDYMASDADRLNRIKDWGKPFFDKINTIFSSYNLPVELKYLAVVESDLKSSATSVVGAAGPWQFMAGTARGLGLKVNKSVDERRDFNKSTKAAARYLRSLYSVYNDWLLVIAAYNAGPGVVNTAIRKSNSRNFWDLQYHLPTESRNHVKKFIATHYIMEGDGGLTTLTRKETDALALENALPVEDANTNIQTISGHYSAEAIMQILDMKPEVFSKMNPAFNQKLSANGSYDLRLPGDKMQVFMANKPEILDLSVKLLFSER